MDKKMKFEEAMSLLEAEVKRIEDGNMPLDEALASYERAIGLVKVCNERLEAAQNRVRILTEGTDGTLTDSPFLKSDDEA